MNEVHEIIRWEAPPPPRSHGPLGSTDRSAWKKVAIELQLSPGKWAVLLEAGRGRSCAMANYIRTGTLAVFQPAGSFEATTRSLGGGGYAVYARAVDDGGDW